jgi:NAD(P)H-hydrate epimerase
MKVFSTSQIKEIDRYTILNEPVSSTGLMERAAGKCTSWITENFQPSTEFVVFAGPGNNGGDGLAIARQLFEKKYLNIKSYILDTGSPFSADMEANLASLSSMASIEPEMIKPGMEFPVPDSNAIVIDALFGSGLSRPLSGQAAALVDHINNSGCRIIAIDIPSGFLVRITRKTEKA